MRSTAIAIATIIGTSCIVGDQSEPDDDVLDLGSALLVSSRDRLEICIEADPGLTTSSDQLATQLRADLAQLRAHHPDWRLARLDDFAVAIGCPGQVAVDPTQRLDAKATAGLVLGPGVQATPSPYRVHLHVISDATAATVLGTHPFARAVAELAVVDDHRVAEVSTALVVRAAMLGTDAFREDALAQSIGLRVAPR